MHILGLSCGAPNGNSETLLKAALKEAAAEAPGTTVSIIRVADISFPARDHPGTFNPSTGFAPPKPAAADTPETPSSDIIDDRPACLDAILDADALILATPVYTRQAAGVLKYFCDKTLGPMVDAAFVERTVEGKRVGNPRFKDFVADERVLKPRVAGLIAAGGASSAEWGSLALPGLHQCVFSLHAKVVDQIHVLAVPFPGVVVGDEAVMAKARKLGKNVASQLGKSFDDAQYLGENPGSCPHCHLDAIVLTGDNNIDCLTCGAKGKLGVGAGGVIEAVFSDEPPTSVITMAGKRRHMDEIRDVGQSLGPKIPSLQSKRQEWTAMDNIIVDLPSNKSTAAARKD